LFAAKPCNRPFPDLESRTVGNPIGLSPPARQRAVAYSSQAQKTSPRPEMRRQMELGVLHSLRVSALKKPISACNGRPSQVSVPEAESASSKVLRGSFLA